jgi:hypothetical protein
MNAPLCPACGKRTYFSRKSALSAARLAYPSKRMTAYRCGGAWHVTSQSPREWAARRARGQRLRAGDRRAAA